MSKTKQSIIAIQGHFKRRSRAQGLVEFALALPVLLLLIFGIIEFGRLLQAWLALENGARFGVRYATTGEYNPAYCPDAVDAFENVRFRNNLEPDKPALYAVMTEDEKTDGRDDCIVHTADGKVNNQITNALQDWARLPSIYDAALSGATGIAWDADALISGEYAEYLKDSYDPGTYDYNVFGDLLPNADHRGNPGEPGFFAVSVCSNRANAKEDTLPDDSLPDGGYFLFDTTDFFYPGEEGNDAYRYRIYCDYVSLTDDKVVRYVDDAGGPGDRVKIELSYRHNLITPFVSDWWPTLSLNAQREGLVEKFRSSRVTGLSGAIGFRATNTYTPPPPTETPTQTNTPQPKTCLNVGGVLKEIYTDISGNYISDLTNSSKYPTYPDIQAIEPKFELDPYNIDQYYGSRWRAYLCPPYDGTYTFHISSDDHSELYLSPNQSEAAKSRIARVNGWTSSRQWDRYSDQTSAGINLIGGQLYYIEALHKEGSGGDNIAVGWTGPSFTDISVIDGQYLVPEEIVLAPTITPTPTPPADCDMLVNLLEQSLGEGLAIQYIDHGGYLLESYLQNVGPYPIYFTGAEMDYNGAWHNEAQPPDPDRIFDLYGWNNNYYNPIYDPSDVSARSYSHTFPSPKIIYENDTGWYKWTYDRSVFNFWITPYVRSYPIPANNRTPTPRWDAGGSADRLFYWNSDFEGVIKYEFRPDGGPVLKCEMDVTGKPGPEIKPTIYPGNTIGAEPFYIRAVVEGNKDLSGNDRNVNEVRFYVYDSNGEIVHYRRDTSAPYCIFGGKCQYYTPYEDSWSRGGVISSDTYTLMIIAQNNDDGSRKKSEAIVRTFRINAPTPTPTRTL
ncbi:MAG: TadE/TadG family type IV pilus assembly protein, partial [Anaerolineaceae bacterium]|nr:TadE/TadG family type IV pilus assembly protein [Anaerolineaceae bacterium]